jgi:hypothetical protein
MSLHLYFSKSPTFLFFVVALEMLQFITFPPSFPLAANGEKKDE